jgi:hypothetical protein
MLTQFSWCMIVPIGRLIIRVHLPENQLIIRLGKYVDYIIP